MLRLRVFVSSPGDVGPERGVALSVAERLQFEFRGQIELETYLWERSLLRATDTFQAQILDIKEADLALFILWSRLGTPLPLDQFSRADGSQYGSGTEYEFERARAAYHENRLPEVVCYVKTAEVRLSMQDRELRARQVADLDALSRFTDKWFRNPDGTFKSAFFSFDRTAQFEDLIEAHLRDWIHSRLKAVQAEPTQNLQWTGSPFRGLQAFDFEHALIYCGRTAMVSEVLEMLRRRAADGRGFLMVTGMSGVGKSSLVRAGVLPLLTRSGVIEHVDIWRRAIYQPNVGNQGLVAGFAAALLEENALPELGQVPDFSAATLRDSAAFTRALMETLDGVARKGRRHGAESDRDGQARLIIACDQFEAIFDQTVAAQERDTFVDALRTAVLTRRVWIIATLRADFFSRCAALPERFRDLFVERDGLYAVGGPRPADITQMVRRPATMAGLEFERRPGSDEGLDDELIDAAVGNPTVLPLLEFTLEELWRRSKGSGLLRFADYEEIGGLDGALRLRADEVCAALPDEVRASLPKVLAAVVHIDPTDERLILQNRVHVDHLAHVPGCQALIDAFVSARLFVADRASDGAPVIGLAHESLLREWPPAVQWIEQNRELLRLRSGIAAAAALWRNSGSDVGRLLSGALLKDAARLLQKNPEALAGPDREFVERSMAEGRRRLKRQISYGAVAAAIVALAIALPIVGFGQVAYAFSLLRTLPVVWNVENRIPLPDSARANLDTSVTSLSQFLAQVQATRKGHPELVGWTLAQIWVALNGVEGGPENAGKELREAATATEDRVCHCWRETDDKLPHGMATAWVIFALAVYHEAATREEIEGRLDRQAASGWWSMYPARETDSNASTSATAFTVLALHRQLHEGLVPADLAPRVETAIRKGADWLAGRAIDGTARWTEYPPEATYEHKVKFESVSALVIHVLRTVTGSSQYDAAWLANLPHEAPPPGENEGAKAYVVQSETQFTLDDVRHYLYPWMLRATIDAYPRGNRTERARALIWLEDALNHPITPKELLNEAWTSSEVLFALRHAQSVLRREAAAAHQ